MTPSTVPPSQFSDLTLLAILLAFSAVSVVVALAAAYALKLDRLAQMLASESGVSISRIGAALIMGLAALGILLGVVPASALLQGWGGPIAGVVVLGALVATSIAVVRPEKQAQSAGESQSADNQNKAAA